jgi:hypothetical protein
VKRAWSAGIAVGVVSALFLLVGLVPGASSAATGSSAAFTQSKTLTRDFDVNGQQTTVDTRNFMVNVAQTTNLFGREETAVTWTGAHPTGGIVANENSIDAQYEEYPVVLLECRGVDSASPPSGQSQLSPETCWTQDWSERYQDAATDQYPPYRLDQYATKSDLGPIVGAPADIPTTCTGNPPNGLDYYTASDDPVTQRWIPWEAADGTVYYGGENGCAGQPPEADVTASLPSNETFGVSDANGDGSAEFDIFTSQQNQTLGCSQTVACSLVVVPIMGISCNVTTSSTPAADATACEDTGNYAPGATLDTGNIQSQQSVTGSLWWSASNWQNRISVPLSFATTSSACSLTGSQANNSIDIYGSELMIRATDQWEPYFCLGEDDNDNYSLVHVQTGEPEARNLVDTGGAEAAFTEYAQPGGYGAPTVNAPVAVTGFTISYSISDADGQPYQNLKMTPLLLAKLLTESYPDTTDYAKYNPAIGSNPQNITQDPEFEQLNSGIPVEYGVDAAAELISLSSDSDVMEALTTYINDDPAARAWLNGTSSGEPSTCNSSGQYAAGATGACPPMVVNPAYLGIQLPVDQWPLLAPLDAQGFYNLFNPQTQPGESCLYYSPVPYLNAIASPLATLENISEDMQFDQPNSEVTCSTVNGSVNGEKLVADPAQAAGRYFMLGITPLADDYPYALEPALLQTTPGTFVGPTYAALVATASLLQPDAATGTWPIPYNEFETAAGQNGYPGTMVVYAAVPTTGLPTADAADIGQILQFAATTGQEQGTGAGQLPPGYLPLTASNGLGALASYTTAAAADVIAQNGQIPAITAAAPSSVSQSSTPAVSTAAPAASTGTTPASPGAPEFSVGFGGDGSVFGSETFAASSVAAAASKAVTATETKPNPALTPLIPLEMTAQRLKDWLGFLGIFNLLGACLFGLVIVPFALLMGRRRGMW